MPAPVDLIDHSPIWAEVSSSDPDAAVAFYCRLFGWTAAHTGPDSGAHIQFSHHDAAVAELSANTESRPDTWTIYFATDNADALSSTITARGGVVRSLDRVGDRGVMLLASDPGGSRFGLWQPGRHRGFGIVNESGAPVWYELHSSNYAADVAFYQDTFGWRTRVLADTDHFRMCVVTTPGDPVAGIVEVNASDGERGPAGWLLYFGVSNTDESAELIPRLGGVLLDEPTDTDFGRLAHAVDPGGAPFTIIQVGHR